MLTRLLAIAVLATGMTACRNSCQRLCDEIRDFAADECGLEWDRAALKECRANHGYLDITSDQRQACSDNIRSLSEEWTCSDIEVYFDAPASTDDTGG